MCGILGQVAPSPTLDRFKEALQKINYRGPDHSGIFQLEGVLLGHNRLSILDLDPRSNQPFISSDQKTAIVFNGEIYNYKELKKELVALGQVFRTESDTEVILNSYKQWGTSCFKSFHGMFSFGILDLTNQKLVLARDRFGEKPLFYQLSSESFNFGSELKAVLGLNAGKPPLEMSAVIDFLHFGYIPAPKTIYKDILKLKPGFFLEYSISSNSITRYEPYYSISFSNNSHSFNEKEEQFNSIAQKVASEISISDVSLGAFLSGGVDSSGAVAFLSKNNSSINTFTAGFTSDHFDESVYARQVADHLNVKNTNRKINYEDFIHSYDKMVNMYDEPHNDFSFIPTYLICKEAAQYHTVMISGDGADEIFCGYPRYHQLQRFEKFKRFKAISSLVAKTASLLPESSNFRRKALLLNQSGPDFFFYLMSMNFTPDMVQSIYGEELKKHAQIYSPRSVISTYLKEIEGETSLIQQQRYLDIKMTLGDDMLVKVDRASMANSIEVRPFYLHPILTDFAFSLSPSDLVTPQEDKYFLKKCLEKDLPKSILYRNKMGFTFPLKELILTELRPFFDECICHLPPSLIDRSGIEKLLTLHKKGDRNFVPQLHSLMYLGLWLKQNGLS